MGDAILDKYEAKFEAEDIIFCEYEKGDEFYIVKEGRVRISKIQDSKEKTLDVFEPPSIFGEMAIIEDAPRSATAIAETDVTLVVLKKHNFFELLTGNPQWALSLIKILSKRIFDAQRRLKILSLREDDAKVLDTILMLVEWQGVNPYGDIEENTIELKGANSESIAHWNGLGPRDVDMILSRYINMGNLERSPEGIVVKNLSAIARLVKNKRKMLDKEI